jgi:hypothetical protein
MAKKINPWFAHLKKVRAANPKIHDVAKIAKIAKASYKVK